jgi:hypothetical protein
LWIPGSTVDTTGTRSNVSSIVSVKPLRKNEFPVPPEKFPVRAKNSLFTRKNSLFRKEQGICLQRIETANKFPLLQITGNLPTTH